MDKARAATHAVAIWHRDHKTPFGISFRLKAHGLGVRRKKRRHQLAMKK